MSAILDALRKLQRDREDETEVPDLRTAVARTVRPEPARAMRPTRTSGTPLLGKLAAAAAVVAASAVVGFYLRSSVETDSASPEFVEPAVAARAPTPGPPAFMPGGAPPATPPVPSPDPMDPYSSDADLALETYEQEDYEEEDPIELADARAASDARRRALARRSPPRRNSLSGRAERPARAQTPEPPEPPEPPGPSADGAAFGRPSAETLRGAVAEPPPLPDSGASALAPRAPISPARVNPAPRPSAREAPDAGLQVEPQLERPPEINFEPPPTRSALAGPGVPLESDAPPEADPEPVPDPTELALLEDANAGLGFPPLEVDSVLWHPVADRREALVLIGGSRATSLREGDIVAGVAVFRINPGSVEFRVGSASKTVPIGQ